MKNKIVEKNNNKEFNDVFLIIQSILSLFSLIFLIISIFERSFYYGTMIILSITLFVVAINNKILYKKKYMTIIYGIFGICLFVCGIVGVINGRI